MVPTRRRMSAIDATALALAFALFVPGTAVSSRAQPDCLTNALGAHPTTQLLADCTALMQQNPSDAQLLAAVSEMRIKLGLLDEASQDLVDAAFSAGDPSPMTVEIEALLAGGQVARAEPLMHRVSAIGLIDSMRPYAQWLLENHRENDAVDLLNRLDITREENSVFLLQLIRTSSSPIFVRWWNEKLLHLSSDQSHVQLALAKQLQSQNRSEEARHWYAVATSNGSKEARSWIVRDLYDGSDATNLVLALNRLGFDAGESTAQLNEQTRRAVRDFQTLTNLSPTGDPNEQTLSLLSLYGLELYTRVSPLGSLSGVGRVVVTLPGRGLERGTGFLAGGRCTVAFSAHAFDSVEAMGHARFYLGPESREYYPNYAFQADVTPVAIGLVVRGSSVLPVAKADWFVGRLSPCAGDIYAPLKVMPNNLGLSDSSSDLYATGFPGSADASRLTVLKCAAEFIETVNQQCALNGMSGGPAFFADPTSGNKIDVAGINTGSWLTNHGSYGNLTPAFAFYLAVERANSAVTLNESEKREILDALIGHGLLSGPGATSDQVRSALIVFQDKYAALVHPGAELWHNRYGRFYSLQPDRDSLSLVRAVADPKAAARPGLAGNWCGQGLHLQIRHSPKGWMIGDGRDPPSRIASFVTAGNYVSLEGASEGSRFAYEFYRQPGSLELLQVDVTAPAPYLPTGLNGVVKLTPCAALN